MHAHAHCSAKGGALKCSTSMFGTSRQLSILTSCIVTLQLKVLRISKKKSLNVDPTVDM